MTETKVTVAGRQLSAFLRRRRPPGSTIFAVVDAARDRGLAFGARDRFGLPTHSLFAEDAPQDMDRVAPYVVNLEPGTDPAAGTQYLDMWAQRLGHSAGILLAAPPSMEKLEVHLGNCFRVTNDEGRRYFFRFYDPRVLRTYCSTCTGDDAKEFFGPIGCIFVEAKTDGDMLTCRPVAGGVRSDQSTVADG